MENQLCKAARGWKIKIWKWVWYGSFIDHETIVWWGLWWWPSLSCPTHPSCCCWTVLTCGRPMEREARRPPRVALPETWGPACLPHKQLGLQAQGGGGGLGRSLVSKEPLRASPSLRRGEKQLATGTQLYTTPGQGDRKRKGGQLVKGCGLPLRQILINK